MGRYLGLRGTSLNIVIGVIAGLDFLLFGYDQGVTGGLLNLRSFYTKFPQIDASPTSTAFTSLSPPAQNHRTTVQGTVLAALSDLPEDDPFIEDEFVMIKTTVMEMSKGSFRDLFTMTEDRHFHRVVLAYVNQMFQQISGINLITYYIPTILQGQVGLSDFLSRLIAACNGTEYFAASWIAVFTIERFGRRSLMLFGALGQSISMAVLAITQSIGSTKAGIGSTVFLFVFNSVFAVGWLGMTWLYPAEIVPLRIRAPANAISTSGNWIWNFMVVMITPVAFSSIGYKTYIIFAVINGALIFPVVYFFYPETAHRSLEEMDIIFRKSHSIFDTVSVAKHEPRRYGDHGELLIKTEQIDDDRLRQASVVSANAGKVGARWHEGGSGSDEKAKL
ncbi:hypothetical protein MMC21_004533 [Puttea exsequens]|nr:hypothetical protein [Puttea exsequens]